MTETKEVTHKRLSAVKSKNSKIELILRRKLFALGYRYRIHRKDIVGKPDLVFARQKVAIFCDSVFWHGYKFYSWKNKIKKNRNFWQLKIERNIRRDKIVTKTLKKEGWVVLRFWESQLESNLDYCIRKIEEKL